MTQTKTKTEKKNVVEWFNEYDHRHVTAFEEFMKTGKWPEDFVPEDVATAKDDGIRIIGKIAQTHISHVCHDGREDLIDVHEYLTRQGFVFNKEG